MADDKRKVGGSDRKLIALGEAYEVRYWSKKFKVTPAKLRYAVKKVGHSAKKVEDYIKLQKHKARDRTLIALSEPYEVRYWSQKFKVSPARAQGSREIRGPLVEKGRRVFCEQENGKPQGDVTYLWQQSYLQPRPLPRRTLWAGFALIIDSLFVRATNDLMLHGHGAHAMGAQKLRDLLADAPSP